MHRSTSHDNKQTIYQSANCFNSIFNNSTKESDFASDFEAVINSNNSPYIDSSKIDNFVIDDHCKSKLLVWQDNIKSLVSNVNFCELEVLLSAMTYKPDIISVTETYKKPQSYGHF